ncbi:MAG TPA: hypothetical protein VMY98_00120 [Anaerolineae bacterium]|nr:hypothetical protein [Anaerolineae bacterium]
MEKWEYRTFNVAYDKRYKNWVADDAPDAPLVGLPAILNCHGSRGWELVDLTADHLQAVAGFGKWHIEPASYRATFKRRGKDRSWAQWLRKDCQQ